MVVPLVLTGEMIKTLQAGIGAMGESAGKTVYSTTYLRTIRRRDKVTKKIIETANPHFPRGEEWNIPAWFMFALILLGGVYGLAVFTDILSMMGLKSGSKDDGWRPGKNIENVIGFNPADPFGWFKPKDKEKPKPEGYGSFANYRKEG